MDYEKNILLASSFEGILSNFYEALEVFKEFNTKASLEKWITDYGKKQFAVLNDVERHIINDYGANAYEYLNRYFRTGVLPSKDIWIEADDTRAVWLKANNIRFEFAHNWIHIKDSKTFIEEYAITMNNAIKKMVVHENITAYRMVVAEEYENIRSKIGENMSAKTFFSTPLIRENAINSGDSLKIFIPMGANAATNSGGLMLQEMELILPIGTEFRVLGEKEVIYPRGHKFGYSGKPSKTPKILELEVIL